jgi:tetratricopeptide (TPR) repeat protein
MKTRFVLPILLLLMLGLGSRHMLGQNSPSSGRTSIQGQARDARTHVPIQHVVVTVENQASGNADQAETDTSGKFSFQGLYPDVYVVKIRVRGYRDESQRLDLTISGSNYVDFELQAMPQDGKAQAPSEEPGGSIDARDAAIPEKARKEFAKGRELLLEGKDVSGSIAHLLKATKIYSQFGEAYLLLGMAYGQKNDAANAKSSVQKAVEVEPRLAQAHITLGMILNGEKDYPAAEKSLTKGLELNPDSAEGQYELAKTYWALGRVQEAEPHAVKSLALRPEMPAVHVLMGNILLRKRDLRGALKEFQEYLRLDPKGPFAEGTRAMVDKLEKSLGNGQ